MNKLELKDIIGYVPYGLKAKVNTTQPNCYIDTITIDNIGANTRDWVNGMDRHNIRIPILRPLSQLTQPIKHKGYNNGEEFVPLVELAKIAANIINDNWKIHKGKAIYETCFTEYEFYIEKESFILNEVVNSSCIIGGDDLIPQPIYDIFSIIDLLKQWMFDIRNLISQKLAVSTESLTVNPYE